MPKDKTVYREGQKRVKRKAGSAGRTGTRVDTYRPRTRTVAALGAAGALGGALAGKFVNTMIASAGQSDLPTTQEYGVTRRRDPRDYYIAEDNLWRSDLLPQGVSVEQSIKDGTWS